ncbi:uncharacterized protein LOC131955840 [Physella acuta]|uniref:uncharacterized protein LOC131955840 n=1 Tax=Physella acuta TaxID=109671 RepID=UPI0027DC417C|nr:uncharacterized protein LOC131955840 [Physella acuta]
MELVPPWPLEDLPVPPLGERAINETKPLAIDQISLVQPSSKVTAMTLTPQHEVKFVHEVQLGTEHVSVTCRRWTVNSFQKVLFLLFLFVNMNGVTAEGCLNVTSHVSQYNFFFGWFISFEIKTSEYFECPTGCCNGTCCPDVQEDNNVQEYNTPTLTECAVVLVCLAVSIFVFYYTYKHRHIKGHKKKH